MKTTRRPLLAYTLVEVAIAAAALVITGATFFYAARNIAWLSAKNAAINLTHTQARFAIHRAVSEIRDAVSIPQLVDASRVSLGTSSGPSAGVSYQQIVAGPCLIWNTAAAGQNKLVVSSSPNDPPVSAGMRLIVPAWEIEEDIQTVSTASGSPPVRTVTLANNIPSAITCTSGSPNYVAYYTQRSALAVVSGELRYYPLAATNSYSVVTRNITSAQPFTIPGGDNRFLSAAFTTQDPRILNRGFKSMNVQLGITIPYRFRLTKYQ